MLYLKSIEITNFKGIKHLKCDFEDFTLLAGLNNSGKTSLLQAVYLLISSIPNIRKMQISFSGPSSQRAFGGHEQFNNLGIGDFLWLKPYLNLNTDCKIEGEFANGLIIQLFLRANANLEAEFFYRNSTGLVENPFIKPNATLEEQSLFSTIINQLLEEISNSSAEFLLPSSIVPTRETMISYPDYQRAKQNGRGDQTWRNSIWWGIHTEGVESFKPIQKLVAQHFPDVDLLLPNLGTDSQPSIQIKYKENSNPALDIAQSGAGLRTFISLARILEQSKASLVLIDEPDSHLHASQQAVVFDLLMDTALKNNRQVIITTHSPEMIIRSPDECVRWIQRDQEDAITGNDMRTLLEKLGVSSDIYIPQGQFPDVIVYVEGKEDKQILDALIRWCHNKYNSTQQLPSTLVIPHKDGRFDAVALQSLSRLIREMGYSSQVVGIRDLDWYYCKQPNDKPEIRSGDNWRLLTLMCKEVENLFCDVELLYDVFDKSIPRDQLVKILQEESKAEELIKEWKYNVLPRIREYLPAKYDAPTKEREADEIFEAWVASDELRYRLVAGKALLKRIRERIKREYGVTCYPKYMFEKVEELPENFKAVAQAIFPNI